MIFCQLEERLKAAISEFSFLSGQLYFHSSENTLMASEWVMLFEKSEWESKRNKLQENKLLWRHVIEDVLNAKPKWLLISYILFVCAWSIFLPLLVKSSEAGSERHRVHLALRTFPPQLSGPSIPRRDINLQVTDSASKREPSSVLEENNGALFSASGSGTLHVWRSEKQPERCCGSGGRGEGALPAGMWLIAVSLWICGRLRERFWQTELKTGDPLHPLTSAAHREDRTLHTESSLIIINLFFRFSRVEH